MDLSKRRTRVAVLVVAGLVAAVVPALAGHGWGPSPGVYYHWARTSNPFTLKVGDNVTSAWDAHLGTAISDWHASSVLNLTGVAGNLNPRTCKGTTGRVDVCNAKYGLNGWLGIASISITGGVHITKGTTKVNDSYYSPGSQYDTPAWRQFVMCQEIGHDFGLGHVNENFSDPNTGSCMDYTDNPAGGGGEPNNEHPNQHDYDQLASIYSHLDSTTTVNAALPSASRVPAMDDLDLNNRAAWGRLVAASAGHGQETYELDLGHGNKIITHVIWTMEAAAKRRAEQQHHD